MALETTYCTVAQVSTWATDNGRESWATTSNEERIRAIVDATFDIENYHKQLRDASDNLWAFEEADMITASIIHSIDLAERQQYYDVATKVKSVAQSNYQAGGLSVETAGKRFLSNHVKFLVKRVMSNYGVDSDIMYRRAPSFARESYYRTVIE
jgi:hypothetical protein